MSAFYGAQIKDFKKFDLLVSQKLTVYKKLNIKHNKRLLFRFKHSISYKQ